MSLFGRTVLPESVDAGGRRVPLLATRHAAARGIKLRADPVAGVVRLTLPPRGAVREAAKFLAAHGDWIAAQVARWPQPLALTDGAIIPFDGAPLTLHWSAGHARTTSRSGDRLLLGGPADMVPARTLRWLKAAALADLTPATRALAAGVGRPLASVAVRDPQGRWGSCATRDGRINYSWRLILAPDWVRASVVAHEVAHLVHANHGRDFHALLASLHPRPAEARRWLKAHGAELHWVGRSA